MTRWRFKQGMTSLMTILLTSLAGCRFQERNLPFVSAPKQTSENESFPVRYGSLTFQDSSDSIIIPLIIERNSKLAELSESTSYYRGSSDLIVNFIFYDKTQNTSTLLLDRPALITAYQKLAPQTTVEANSQDNNSTVSSPSTPRTPQSIAGDYWLYQIIERDTNQDRTLSEQDEIRGYLSSLKGDNLVAITPENTRLINWDFSPQFQSILIKVQTKPENAIEFQDNAPSLVYLYDLKAQKQILVTPENTQVQNWYMQQPQSNSVLLEVRWDLNRDGKFQDNDAVVLYLYNLENKTLHQLTPKTAKLQEWQIDPNRKLLFARISQDSDKNQTFDEKDAVTFIKINLEQPQLGIEIFDAALHQKIESLYRAPSNEQ
jgi:hypothetical protein